MLLKVLKRILSTQLINHALLVQAVVQQKVLNLLNVITVRERGKSELIRGFLLFNKHVLSAAAMAKLLVSRVMLAAAMVRFKLMKM